MDRLTAAPSVRYSSWAELNARARIALDSVGYGIIITDAAGIVDYLNPAAERLTGWTALEANGKLIEKVFQILRESTGDPVPDPLTIGLSAKQTAIPNDLVLVNRGGKHLAAEYHVSAMVNQEGKPVGVVILFQDVGAAREQARRLSYQATHDSLTGLVNRREFNRRIDRVLWTAREEKDRRHALLFLDLDHFKAVTDMCGHLAGDELLRQVSGVISEPARERDTVAHIGGDEFAVLLERCPLEQAVRIANDLCKRLEDFRFVWEGKTFAVGISIGVVSINADSGSVTDVLRAADAASFIAREAGGNRVHVHQVGEAERVTHRDEASWVARLNNALQDNRLTLTRQTIAPLNIEGQGEHYEILIRLRLDDRDTVPAAAFLPAAERYNLMPVIDRWVIRTLVDWFIQAPEQLLHRTHTCSVNLSGPSLNDDRFAEYLEDQLGRVGELASKICFEVTETAAIANLPRAREFINHLRAIGCRFALDDFGKGMSSLAYLKHLPVDFIKIDGQFVRDIAHDSIDRTLVESITRIAKVLDVKTVAECVEDQEIVELVSEIGVDYAQGHLIDRPVPLTY